MSREGEGFSRVEPRGSRGADRDASVQTTQDRDPGSRRYSNTYNLRVRPGNARELAAISLRVGIQLWHPEVGWLAQPVRGRFTPGRWVVGWARVRGLVPLGDPCPDPSEPTDAKVYFLHRGRLLTTFDASMGGDGSAWAGWRSAMH